MHTTAKAGILAGALVATLIFGAQVHAQAPAGATPPPPGAESPLPAPGRPANCPGGEPPAAKYLLAGESEFVSLLPPAPDEQAHQRELQAVLKAQRAARVDGRLARAIADSELTCARFKDVLGPNLKSEAAKAALAMVDEAARNASGGVGSPKRYWKRPRPYVVSSEVQRHADVVAGARAADTEYPLDPKCNDTAPPRDAAEAKRRAERAARDQKEKDYTSYPSGHAAFGYACGLLLARVVPEKRDALFARGKQYGESRIIIGAHYPSDVEMGRVVATVGTALMSENARFQREFAEASVALRAALGLPAQLPDLERDKDFFKGP